MYNSELPGQRMAQVAVGQARLDAWDNPDCFARLQNGRAQTTPDKSVDRVEHAARRRDVVLQQRGLHS